MKIKFLTDCQVLAQGEVVQKFKAGHVKELSDASAMHWLNRGMAEIYAKPVKAEAKAEEADEADK